MGEKVPLSGGMDFVLPPGTIHAPNITNDPETGIGEFTDGEIARTLRYGIKRDGSPMVDFMPFYDLSDRDLQAIISYLRFAPPVKNVRPANKWNFMGKAILAFGLIKPMGDGIVPASPEPDTTAAYGNYLAESVANCRGCHTQRDLMTGAYIGTDYSGNQPFEVYDDKGNIIKGKHLVTPNLTPDTETGRMAMWPKEVFIARMRAGTAIPGSPMPWGAYKTMTDDDLAAIYKYLQSLEPVNQSTPIGVQDGDPM
jgi:mono/diheme cytochrome c family protein